MASSGLPTAPAQFPPHDVHGKPAGAEGSAFTAAADADVWSSAVAIPDKGGNPRAVRSRLVATNSCCWGDSWAQSLGSAMLGSPSWFRALAMAARTAPRHGAESS